MGRKTMEVTGTGTPTMMSCASASADNKAVAAMMHRTPIGFVIVLFGAKYVRHVVVLSPWRSRKVDLCSFEAVAELRSSVP